ncbi:hypothetical protein RIR_jg19308.t1 [Rhizophagus irregularis DAOM 181602=DAOM 197198]|uniref:Uncharacterized protein n=1 Tax=Rhizophagus irregularis (strain DAOM 197198w) TaxID=1432141 RepID=A0A015KCX3_RHIIW|nr:hypothetical protein RirG_003800 [Rhizophagus irregularis DAOM 197198w]GET51123.1 hypothetical protein RIR_jg19308.t1 [Rhizophagus irregularis DAOM 181602=DAOM 197198]
MVVFLTLSLIKYGNNKVEIKAEIGAINVKVIKPGVFIFKVVLAKSKATDNIVVQLSDTRIQTIKNRKVISNFLTCKIVFHNLLQENVT